MKGFTSIKKVLMDNAKEEAGQNKEAASPSNTINHFIALLRHKNNTSQKYIANYFPTASQLNNLLSQNNQNNQNSQNSQNYQPSYPTSILPNSKEEMKDETVIESQIINFIESICITKMGIRNYDNMQNQDVILEDQITSNCKIFGIFDGHGQYGKVIAQTTKNIFSNLVQKYSQEIKNQSHILTIQNIIKKVIEKTNSYLLHYKAEQAQQSGTTALIVIITKNKIYSFNIGNSRAVLGKYYPKAQKVQPFQITQDHTIDRFDERMRILNSGGNIGAYKNQKGELMGPERIWVKNKTYPGTFLTRIVGLSCANGIGVISESQISIIQYKKGIQYLIMGSDGLWSVMKNSEVVKIIQSYRNQNIQVIAGHILDQAVAKWKKLQELIDDISFILIFLE